MIRRIVWPCIWLTVVMVVFAAGTAVAGMTVFVSIMPQKYFVQQISMGQVDVRVMVPPGASPASYAPKPRQMAALSNAAIYFAVGVPFEGAWLARIAAANPKMIVVHTDEGIEKSAMAAHHHHDGHHNGGGHHNGALDPHIWLSPPLVLSQARTILSALQKADPTHRDAYAKNHAVFASKVTALDRELRSALADRRGLRFMVFHPSWGYFARAYGLIQVPIEIEGKEPKPAQLAFLIQEAREHGIQVVFVQPQFSAKSAALVAGEIGGQVVVADPLAEDWAGNLRAVARQFRDAAR